jgi:hypothetical protein
MPAQAVGVSAPGHLLFSRILRPAVVVVACAATAAGVASAANPRAAAVKPTRPC